MDETARAALRLRIVAMLKDLSHAADAAQGGTATVELDQQKVGRLSRMDALQQQAMAKASSTRLTAERHRLQQALARIDTDPDYGFCANCGEPIPAGRLDIDPAARLCVSCQTG